MEQLLSIAKNSIESFVRGIRMPKFKISSEKLKEKRGVFVTLKKAGELRGCIGCTVADKPLYQQVSEVAIAAAFGDPRFPAVSEEELPELEYEISVLSPLKKIKNPAEIKLGVHGVQIAAGRNVGLFLPQVAKENNWDLETFLDNLMLKAGLEPGYWRENPVDFYIFEAEIIK